MRRMMSSKGGTPMDASSGEGSGVNERFVMDEGQTLLMRMSMICEGAAVDLMAARDE